MQKPRSPQCSPFALSHLKTYTASAQLKTSDSGNQPVSEMADSPIQKSGTPQPQEAQISPEEYKRLMKELEEAKKLMEERNLALEKLMKE